MTKEYKFKDGQVVFARMSPTIGGHAFIRGISSTGIWGIGDIYIIEPMSPIDFGIDPDEYPYRFIACAETQFVPDQFLP